MAPPQWAYQVENFEPPPDEELICSICRAIFCEPVQCPCNHVFCRVCIFKWLQTNRSCPICRKRVTKYSIQDVVPLIKNMIMKLTLHCRNSENGCTEKFTLEMCEIHMRDCVFELVKCRYKPCDEKLFRKDIRDHELHHCVHRYVKCKKCNLKIITSGPSPNKHNCIRQLRELLLKKTVTIKKKNQKILDLQKEIKNLKEADRDTSDSDTSSLGSISTADIMIRLADAPGVSSDSSLGSGSDTEYHGDSLAIEWTTDHNFIDAENSDNAESPSDEFPSIEYPRTSSPVIEADLINANPVSSPDEEVALPRRPAKRRHPPQILNSSDDDNDLSGEFSSLPSPKRSWRLSSNESVDRSHLLPGRSGNPSESLMEAGPSYSGDSITTSSTSTNDSSSSKSRGRFNFRPRMKSKHSVGESAQTAQSFQIASPTSGPCNGSTAFERTIAMLEQYNLESDPEWLPPNSSDSEANAIAVYMNGAITSSDESSLDDSDSSDSFEDAPNGTADLLHRCFDSDDEDDQEYEPF